MSRLLSTWGVLTLIAATVWVIATKCTDTPDNDRLVVPDDVWDDLVASIDWGDD